MDEADAKTKGILFGLCYFHAVMMERKMFGAFYIHRHLLNEHCMCVDACTQDGCPCMRSLAVC